MAAERSATIAVRLRPLKIISENEMQFVENNVKKLWRIMSLPKTKIPELFPYPYNID